MELSKSLLTAVAAGMLALSTTSCEKSSIKENHSEFCVENCTINHAIETKNDNWENCPACGMG